jgi:hypothetical protein
MVATQGPDELVLGHRGATLDAGLPGPLAQLLHGLPLKVPPALSLVFPGPAGSAPCLGELNSAPFGRRGALGRRWPAVS